MTYNCFIVGFIKQEPNGCQAFVKPRKKMVFV